MLSTTAKNSLWGLILLFWGGATASADLRSDVLGLTGGMRTKIVWQKDKDAILGFDTQDGRVREVFKGPVGERSWPILSTDGKTVFFVIVVAGRRGEIGTIHSVAWDAAPTSEPKKLCDGMAPVAVWKDPQTGVEWLYVATKPGRDRRPSHFVRIRTDDPAKSEPVWDKTDMDAPFSLSADGRYGACQVQWPRTGLVTMPNGEVFPSALGGCNANVLPDNSYRMFALSFSHTEVFMYRDLVFGQDRPHKTIELKVDSKKTHRVRATNHPRLFTYYGPMESANYSDIFLAKFDKDYAAVEASVRLTDDKARKIEHTLPYAWVEVTDRADFAYPLGQFFGEAPLPVALPVYLASDDSTWDFGDGDTGKGKVAQHVYAKAGDFALTLEIGGKKLTGRVRVQPTEPPRVAKIEVLGINRLKVHFSEKIVVRDAKAAMKSGNPVQKMVLAEGGDAVILDLEQPLAKSDQLEFTGVTDRAAKPNGLAPPTVAVMRPAWPSEPQGLVSLWSAKTFYGLDASCRRYEPRNFGQSSKLQHRNGYPLTDRYGRLILPTGENAVPDLMDKEDIVRDTVGKSRQVSLELVFTPRRLSQRDDRNSGADPQGRVHLAGWFSGAKGQPFPPLFAVSQVDRGLSVSVAPGGEPATMHAIAELDGIRPYHLVVTYQPGELAAYLDGKQVLKTDAVKGALERFAPVTISGTDRWSKRWSGWLDAAALYSRALSVQEAAANHQAWQQIWKKQSVPPYVLARVKLLAKSDVPTPERIAPYRNALVVNEYAVLEALRGELPAKKIRVVEWGLYDAKKTKSWAFSPDRVRDLTVLLEPFVGKPDRELLFDTLKEDFDAPTLLRVEEWIHQQ